MLAHAEYAKRTVNMLALLTKDCILFSSRIPWSEYYLFSLFINGNFSLRSDAADIISP